MGKFKFETVGKKITSDMKVGDYRVTLQTSSSNLGGWFELIMPPGFFDFVTHSGDIDEDPNKVQVDLGLKFRINDNCMSVTFSKYSSLEMLKTIIDKAIDQISNGTEAKIDPLTNEYMFPYEYEKEVEKREYAETVRKVTLEETKNLRLFDEDEETDEVTIEELENLSLYD